MKAEKLKTILNKDDNRQRGLVRQREALAQQLLGERYGGVYDFFCDVLEDESSYKILRARRCQVLFELFASIIMVNEDLQVKGTFLSSNALEGHMNALCDNSVSVLIVDDVLIHGRGIKQLYEQLDSSYTRTSIRIMVYCRALSAAFVNEELDERFVKKYLPVFDYEWRLISCCFVDLIIASVIPYESFAGSLEKHTQFDLTEAKNDFNSFNNLESEDASAYILFEKRPMPIFFKSIGYDACLRVYTSNRLKTTAYVPFVFTKNILASSIPQLVDFMVKHLDNNRFAHTINALLVKDEKLIVYQMRLFSALVNRIYGVYLLKEYSVLNDAKFNRINMELCFGDEITKELLNTRYEDISVLLNERPPYDVGTVSEDEELEAHLKIYDQNGDYFYRFLSMYYFINGQYDEERAKKKMPRKAGLSIGCFYKKVNVSLRHELTAAQLKCWEYGQASGVMRRDNSGTVSLFGIAGEQNFRYILQENKEFFRELATNCTLSFMDIEKKMDTTSIDKKLSDDSRGDVQNLPDDIKDFQKQNRDLMKKFLQKNSSNMIEWFIPQVLS